MRINLRGLCCACDKISISKAPSPTSLHYTQNLMGDVNKTKKKMKKKWHSPNFFLFWGILLLKPEEKNLGIQVISEKGQKRMNHEEEEVKIDSSQSEVIS